MGFFKQEWLSGHDISHEDLAGLPVYEAMDQAVNTGCACMYVEFCKKDGKIIITAVGDIIDEEQTK